MRSYKVTFPSNLYLLTSNLSPPSYNRSLAKRDLARGPTHRCRRLEGLQPRTTDGGKTVAVYRPLVLTVIVQGLGIEKTGDSIAFSTIESPLRSVALFGSSLLRYGELISSLTCYYQVISSR